MTRLEPGERPTAAEVLALLDERPRKIEEVVRLKAQEDARLKPKTAVIMAGSGSYSKIRKDPVKWLANQPALTRDTTLRGAKDGLLLTRTSVHFKQLWKPVQSAEYAFLKSASVE
jgi:hypothetical protein